MVVGGGLTCVKHTTQRMSFQCFTRCCSERDKSQHQTIQQAAAVAAFYAAGATDASRHPGQVPGEAAAAASLCMWV